MDSSMSWVTNTTVLRSRSQMGEIGVGEPPLGALVIVADRGQHHAVLEGGDRHRHRLVGEAEFRQQADGADILRDLRQQLVEHLSGSTRRRGGTGAVQRQCEDLERLVCAVQMRGEFTRAIPAGEPRPRLHGAAGGGAEGGIEGVGESCVPGVRRGVGHGELPQRPGAAASQKPAARG